MKKLIIAFSLFALIAGVSGCVKDGIDSDTSFLNTAAVGKTAKIFDISNDNSGNVKITPLGEGASSFVVKFGDGTGTAAQTTVNPGSSATHAYPEGSYTVTIVSRDVAGRAGDSTTYPLQVTYRAPENLTVTISDETKVKATALYAKSFLVYYGDVANEVGTPMAIGQELPAHTYPASGGPFVLKVEALSGGAAKTTYTKTLFGLPIDFENANINYFFGTF